MKVKMVDHKTECAKKHNCSDCKSCQWCSDSKCRMCLMSKPKEKSKPEDENQVTGSK